MLYPHSPHPHGYSGRPPLSSCTDKYPVAVTPLFVTVPLWHNFLNRGVACAPQAKKNMVEKKIWKEVFFVHSDTTVQKRPSRSSEKICTFIFPDLAN